MQLATGTTVQLKTAAMLVKERRIDFRRARKASNAGATPVVGGAKAAAVAKDPKGALVDVATIHGLVKWKVPRKIGPGLSNLGNTCYLNSVLQCLVYTPAFAQYLIPRAAANTAKPGMIKAGFAAEKVMARLMAQMHASNAPKVVQPRELVVNLKQIAKYFRIGRQEDSHEFFRHFLDSMHKTALKAAGLKDDNSPRSLSTLVHSVFGGLLRSYVQCAKCKHVSERTEPYLDLSLEISSGISTISGALRHFTAVETLDVENAWKCSGCSQRSRASKGLSIETVPNALVLHLKRFDVFHGKLKKHVAFDESLDLNLGGTVLSPKCKDKKLARYKLTGVLVHSGMSPDCGHYYAFVKSPAGQWFEMNDECVRMVQLQTVLSQRAYMLFYTRESVPQPPQAPTPEVQAPVIPKQAPAPVVVEEVPAKVEEKDDDVTSEESFSDREDDAEEPLVKGSSRQEAATPVKRSVFAPAFTGRIGRFYRFGRPWKRYTIGGATVASKPVIAIASKLVVAAPLPQPEAEPVAINPRTLNKNSLFGADVPQWNDDEKETADATSIALQTEHNKKVRLMNQEIHRHKKSVGLDTWDQTLDLGKLKKVKKRKEFVANEGAGNKFQKALEAKKRARTA
ncbi:ubiquitin-specific protease [Achlya hypogyna]|uniref:Ubiquitin carboxyl-terminal hydrolase n=1 Tax=Achlya hypogyna TaxID=1202772 RepID=A0A1V9YAQ6_ACHHY|nr:ubiquitin-specific protease [Achlya hypogyna]